LRNRELRFSTSELLRCALHDLHDGGEDGVELAAQSGS
jgi:hypothetical protein